MSAAKLSKDHSQSSNLLVLSEKPGSVLKGKKPYISPHLQYGTHIRIGGIAATHPSFDTVSQASGTGL